MKTVFLCLLGIHLVHSVVAGVRHVPEQPKRISIVLLLTQSPMFFAACYLAWRQDVFSRQLISPFYIGCGLLAGHLIFGLSVWATCRSWRAALEMLGELGRLWQYLVDSPVVIMRVLVIAVSEEIIYRAAAQPLLAQTAGSAIFGIVAVAAGFSIVHAHFFRNPVPVSIEFVGFSILLGILYHLTDSLILVTVIHAVRNIEISFLEFAVKLDEHGDKERAMSEVQQHFIPGNAAQ